jgi:hypothetical protein
MIFLNITDKLIFIIEIKFVSSDVEIQVIKIIYNKFIFQQVNNL